MESQQTDPIPLQHAPPAIGAGPGTVEGEQVATEQLNSAHGAEAAASSGDAEILCGPLLNYKHRSNAATGSPIWHGSVLVVVPPARFAELELVLRLVGPVKD